ncbi:MAG TPA: hypothetical protein VEU29_07930 [Actinomycetota bacterium]|nr:hypothetical protein [Actinomycetota bacterium]
MKKIFATTVALALVAGALSAPALAGKKKKAPKPVPVPVTLYFHGTETAGEVDAVNNLTAGGAMLPMNSTEPTGSPSKSFPILDGVVTPNEACSGSSLFPSWTGTLSGRVVGDVKVTFNTIASAGNVDVELFVDAGPLSCNETYVEPVAETTIDLPNGTGTAEAVIEGVDIPVGGIVTVMINPRNLDAPAAGRILYDSAADPSRIELTCIPAAGAKSCV